MNRFLSILALSLAMMCLLDPSAATAAAGKAFSFGSNSSGITGLGTNVGNTLVATPIVTTNLGGRSIAQLASGLFHNLVLAEDGTVYSFGQNGNGRTGLGTTSGNTLVATPIDTSNLGGRLITQIVAGSVHGLLLAEDGSVFSFGSNTSGQTGRGTNVGNTLVATPIDTSNLGGRSITDIAAGAFHNLLLAEDGSVFSFGQNGNGRTGLGTTSGLTLVASPIDTSNLGGRSITQVSAGGDYSLLLADDGSVFSFGSNGNGTTGLGTTNGNTLVATPIDTSNLGGRSITQLSAGGHGLLLADDGGVFSFGQNFYGATGLGTIIGNTLVATPIDASNLGGRAIMKVSAGGLHSLLLAEDGTVFSFGTNSGGRTGLGTAAGNTLVATAIDTTNLGGLAITHLQAGGVSSLLIAIPEPSTTILTVLALLAPLPLFPRHRSSTRVVP